MDKITLLDGAFGTEIWKLAKEQGLPKLSTWRYNIEYPDLVEQIHKAYAKAGAQIIYSNTFCANSDNCGAEGFDAEEVVRAGVKLAGAAGKRTALDIGPLFKALEPFGDVTEDQCREIYAQVCRAGADAGAELIVLETFMDIDMLAIAAGEAKKTGLPVFCCMSFEKADRTLYGAGVDDIIQALTPLEIDAIGLNCSYGPEHAVPVIKKFSEKTDLPLILKPNTADLPPEGFAEALKAALPYVSYLGSCCGSDPRYTKALAAITE